MRHDVNAGASLPTGSVGHDGDHFGAGGDGQGFDP